MRHPSRPSSPRSPRRASPSAARRVPMTASAKQPWRTGNVSATSSSTELLRLVTAGSVDDGKSTLIGRLLFDARQGVVEQTRRHAYIASILEIPHVVFAVNKMDLVDFAQERFDEIVIELEDLNARLGTHDPKAIPMSALRGDNVVDGCAESMPWWDGPPLLEFLEQIQIATDRNLEDRRFPVQWVIRPMSDEHHDYRGYAGRVASGIWQAGDEVVVLPSGLRTRVEVVENADGPLDAAVPPMSITVRLEDDVDV